MRLSSLSNQRAKKLFNIIGWTLLIAVGLSWAITGYSNWYSASILLSYLSFSISDNSLKRIKQLTAPQIILILSAFILSVAIVLSLIQIANNIINNTLQLTGTAKTVSTIIAIIICLYPIKLIFGYIVYKIFTTNEQNKEL